MTLLISDTYPQVPALQQRWADFLASLLHGAELARVLVFLAPLAEVQGICGQDALACYDPSRSVIVSPGDDPNPSLSAEAVMTHEYGHHVANHRPNPPFKSCVRYVRTALRPSYRRGSRRSKHGRELDAKLEAIGI